MELQEVLWAVTALGAFVAFAGLVMLVRGRGREPGVVALVVMIGALLCTGGFLLSVPRYRDTALIAGGAAIVGVLAMLGAISLMPVQRGPTRQSTPEQHVSLRKEPGQR
ncbi:hypothetical protein [Embleya scabrispora]|uniref:hypothetical protein n=1 Tax=Embleya scabrispora TaxID=159449 RepID=UPI0003790DC0|nr:hypothetical protein [Embleya scabrispora]MYS79341.1 hypothetical protein [Streptomyces sp. SID5474]